jgi:hypothetical protein
MENAMPFVCNLTCGLLLAAALIVPQYASAAPQMRYAKTELCRAKAEMTYIGPR